MKMLKPNTGEKIVPIAKYHVYVFATDTKNRFFLKELKIAPGHHTWEWVSLRTDRFIDISSIGDNSCSFENAINKAVNDPYSTVYELENFNELFKSWDDIKYVEGITTIYKCEDKPDS
jgi:hypothetical protein